MTMPACPKCGSHSFEVQALLPQNSDHALTFVNCTKCGSAVGVMDQANVGHLVGRVLNEIADKLGVTVNAS